MIRTQAQRQIEITTPLGRDVLLFRRMTAAEALGRLFEYDVELLSENENINIDDILGQPVTVRLNLPHGEQRFFNGIVSCFTQAGRVGDFAAYHAMVKPWLWLLTRTANCRIFQNKTVPDILKQVFRDHGFTDFDDHLSGTYRALEYCVQYRESDFNFVSRLMEQAGIYYFFKHENGKHMLVLADAYTAHGPISGYEQVPYFPPSANVVREREHVFDWAIAREVQPGAYVLDDFDFTRPKAELQVKLAKPHAHAGSNYEVYDYPGEYGETASGEGYVRARLEALHAEYERVEGQSDARGLFVGGLFELTDYPRADQNCEHLIVSARYELRSDEYETGVKDQGPFYVCHFTALDGKVPFRTPCTTPKPIVQGPQTAIVVGPAGEEIWTDAHGRVKVQFHWDREGQFDENSSCWIRVSQVHAGRSFGGIDVPRIGEEVIIQFLEGDPDRPIVVGRVYNGDNKPPTGLPSAGMVSGIKSNSTPGGGGYNEVMLDDTKGKEHINIHGQYDMATTVQHDQTNTINNNRTTTVVVDDTETVGNNQAITVGANQTESVGVNQSISVGAAKTETITLTKALTIGAAYQVSVGAIMNETVGGAKAEEIGGAKIVVVGINSSETVAVNKSVSAGGNISESAGKDVSVSSGKEMSFSAGDDYSVSGGKKGIINIADQLTIICGKASITMKKDGTIVIKGKDITVGGSGKINVKASSDVVIKGSKVGIN